MTTDKHTHDKFHRFLLTEWSHLVGIYILHKRKNLYQVALLSTFYKGDHGGLIIQ